jgi:hypothetical protein
MTNFSSSVAFAQWDFPSSGFVNGLSAIPQPFLPYYNAYSLNCVPMGSNGSIGPALLLAPANFVQEAFQSADWYNLEISTLINSVGGTIWGNQLPFLDGTTQLRQNLIFQMESADEINPLQFSVSALDDTRPSVLAVNPLSAISFFPNYAWANFHMRYYQSVGLVDEFKPFEDNYFYRNFVLQSAGDLNPYGSLVSGVGYVGGGQSPPADPLRNVEYDVQIPNQVPYAFPNYAYAASGTTNPPSPLLSTHSQAVFSTWPDYGTIGASYDNSWGLTLASGQSNIFGLPYQSLAEYYSDGASLYSQTYSAGQTIIDAGASNGYACFYYPQVGAPRLQTVGYFFGVAARDYLPGDVEFTPMTGTTAPIIATPGTPLLLGAWAEESVDV